jgi:mono/diheme cytochrome c family protein
MKSQRILKLAVAAALPLSVFGMLGTAAMPTVAAVQDFDAAATYKTKCAMCHKATAEKAFDATKADDALVQAILKGVATEKPPAMPAYEAKGVTEDQAKALVGLMKDLRKQAPAQ